MTIEGFDYEEVLDSKDTLKNRLKENTEEVKITKDELLQIYETLVKLETIILYSK